MKDLRGFVEELDKRGELVRVKKPVSLKHEIGDVCRAVNDETGPALQFDNVIEAPGSTLLCNLVGSPDRAALALNTVRKDAVRHYLERSKQPIEPVVTRNPAPCQEVVFTGADADVTKLPIPIWHPDDGGAYVSFGIQISRDPETGVRNASILRHLACDEESCVVASPETCCTKTRRRRTSSSREGKTIGNSCLPRRRLSKSQCQTRLASAIAASVVDWLAFVS